MDQVTSSRRRRDERPGGDQRHVRPAKTHRIGRYEIRDVLGSGGFAVVYKGYDPTDRRPVAIKVCDRHDTETRERFRREAAIGKRLAHRNLTSVYDFGADGSSLYLVQEYLPGEDLADMIRRRETRSLAQKLAILRQIASGLACAHARGILHRDVKPPNIRIREDGRVKIMDFGSAKRPQVDGKLTEVGMIVGTMAYMPPECILGQLPRARSDVFAFGVVAYELMAFRRPFDSGRIPHLIDQVLHSTPAPLADCPPDVAETIDRCLSKEPDDRWPSVAALELDLERLLARYTFVTPGRERPKKAKPYGLASLAQPLLSGALHAARERLLV